METVTRAAVGQRDVLFQRCPLCEMQPPSDNPEEQNQQVLTHLSLHLVQIANYSFPWLENMISDDIPSTIVSTNANETESLHGSEEEEDLKFEDTSLPLLESRIDNEWSFLSDAQYLGHEKDPVLQPFISEFQRSSALDILPNHENLLRRGALAAQPPAPDPPPAVTRPTSPEMNHLVAVDAQNERSNALISMRRWAAGIRTCYWIVVSIFLVVSFSLSISLWWSISHNDISGGFTVGAYVVAVASLPVGFVSYKHNDSCRCWARPPRRRPSDLESEFNLPRRRSD